MALVVYTGTTDAPGATVSVFLNGTLEFVDLYADTLPTPLANPFTSDENTGEYLFFADDGAAYDIVVS